ncbi:unnamed protein product [Allacma fusca]|uniref:Uncharacterized protein n=1 Tax=Allacma fusca TaxID=39272 RepID=A0A8J2K9I3_9HEXA|nr:unnamed protein product [Allacma fusca]
MNGYVPSAGCPSVFGYGDALAGACNEVVSYQFPLTMYYPGINKTSKDYPLSKNLVEIYAGFSEMGKPTKFWGEVQNWSAYDRINRFGVIIGNDGGMSCHFMTPEFAKSFPIWTALLKNELAAELETPEQETF